MVIRLQKYNGKNFYNNAVTIDFKKKKVRFKPIKGEKTRDSERYSDLGQYYGMFVSTNLSIFVRIYLWFFFCHLIKDYINNLNHGFGMVVISILYFPFTFLITSLMCLIFFNKKFREEWYPKVNMGLLAMRSMLKLKNPYKKYTFLSSQLNKEFKIGDFNNIYLRYRFTKDTAKQISKIIIEPFSKYDSGKWLLRFVFFKKPKSGELKLTYI